MNTKTDISAAYVGSTGVDKLCLGNEVVWENFVPYERQYLTIQALEQGDFTIRRPDISYSVNKGPWVTITGATTISLDQDDTVRFKGIKTGTLGPGYQAFSANTLSFITYGNVESLEYGDNFVGQTTMLGNFMRCFHSCQNLADVSNLILPATALTPNSYYAMFYDCSGITASPVLPAPSVPYQGYRQMFYGCTSLTAITCYATEIHEDGTWRWTRYVAPSGTFYRDENMYDWNINTGDTYDTYDGIPENWIVVPPLEVPYDEQYLTFGVLSDGDIVWAEVSSAEQPITIEYSKNDGPWTQITSASGSSAPAISVVSGDTVRFRGDNLKYSGYKQVGNVQKPYKSDFSRSTCTYDLYGNMMSMVDSTGFAQITSIPSGMNIASFFAYQGPVDASNMVLPATTLANYCYQTMFSNCTSLTQAPALPATAMTTSCYSNMFAGCTSLTTAPVLPATALAESCYNGMFEGCTGLTQAPALPATTLADGCYSGMFSGCANLSSITCYATEIAEYSTSYWVDGVASAGTFYRDSSATGWRNGPSGIPRGWTVVPPMPVVPYEQMYLTVEVVSEWGGMLQTQHEVQYSLNGGEWQTSYGGIMLEPGDKVRLKSVASYGQTGMFQENSDFDFKVYGNIESMEYGDDFTGATAVKNASAFEYYFSNSAGLVDAGNLVLPATAMTTSCYSNMFAGCTSLTTAPVLPATALTENCYNSMFQGCASLSSITCLATTIASYSVDNWVLGVSSTGTFYKHPDMNDWPTGDSGIPSDWTVLDYTP